ncbi:hypothetical protein QNI19_17175 [Cytophagaceae bacterium DM2B3-1]|uniref:Uncharacterized protein n=1 Tax=Xanthocytophaga flava TaxID=3048013 RepID=A0ABT7CLQ4_9BACT|nr:hypothetical protein [Xanthocytophaga flavus]MDJ1473513.1 hypothetical protein [Xanthocytophaga flavus]MDJ1494678.1 hypothetical protein [Xanthocytophaga flavus]
MEKLFEISKTQKKLLSIYLRGDSKFWLGYILNYTSETIDLQHFSTLGKPDGIIVIKTYNIERVEFTNDYTKSFDHLIQNSQLLETQTVQELESSLINEWPMNVLKQFLEKEKLISLEVNDTLETGFVRETGDDCVIIHSIGTLGEDNGLACYRIADINSIQVDTQRQRKAELLYRWRKEKNKLRQN